eukprot:TRINITY_DN2713_c0_g1_i1.p1 TRINITY_DN2713_c0_g1~~TRINITY_DN2713_c0_g1_i1.p1  ORF type:complete len:645 (+),score=151.23 TRINITY_DN2713_c0_g1_i1:407-2341(+)
MAEKHKKQEEQRSELKITDEEKTLHQPEIKQGKINTKSKFATDAETIEGVLSLFLDEASGTIVEEMNRNISFVYSANLQKRSDEVDSNIKKVRVENGIKRKLRPEVVNDGTKGDTLYKTKKVRKASNKIDGKRVVPEINTKSEHYPVTKEEFKKFLGVLLFCGEMNITKLKQLWNKGSVNGSAKVLVEYPLVRNAFGRDRFLVLYKCFRFTDTVLEKIEECFHKTIKELWIAGTVAAVDESMVPCKSKTNVHHVFVRGKPHPNGVKVWSTVDYSGFLVNFALYRRIVEKTTDTSQLFPKLADVIGLDVVGENEKTRVARESVDETIKRMASVLPEGTLIVADSYFGGVPALTALVEGGYHVLLSCTQSRPNYLFKDHLGFQLSEDGDSAEVYGEVKYNKQQIPFVANSFQSQGKAINTLSTVFTTRLEKVEIEKTVLDETSEDKRQHKTIKVVEIRPVLRIKYQDLMGFVDQADAKILQGLSKTRKTHWTSAYMNWLLSAMLLVNSQKLYQSAKGDFSHKTQSDWNMAVIRSLLGFKPDGEHPHSTLQRGAQKRGRCKSCYLLHDKRDRKTSWYCPVCTYICQDCESNGDHLKFATGLGKGHYHIRHTHNPIAKKRVAEEEERVDEEEEEEEEVPLKKRKRAKI